METISERTNRRRILLAAALLLLAHAFFGPAEARAQWTTNGNDINNTNTGNVKVGGTGATSAAPTSVLHTKGNLSSQLTGTVAVTQNSLTVTGTGTAFTTELAVGDSIKIGTSAFTVSAISSATSLTLDSNYTGTTASGLSAFRDPGLFAVDNGAGFSKLALDRSGKLGIGTATPTSRLSIIETATTASRGIGLIQYSSDTTPALLNMTKIRGVSGAPVSVANGDTLALISANAYTGAYLATAGIHFIVNGAVSQPSAPTDIVFKAGNTGFGPERMRITSGGYVGIGNPAPSFTLDVAGQIRSSSGGFVFPDGTTQATAVSPVTFGSSAGTAVQGNTTLTVTAGAGMTGGGTATLGSGGTLTLTNNDKGSAQNIFKNVGNAAGATQFSAGSNADTLRFEGTGGTTVSFDSVNRKVVINSDAASSSGWTDSGTSVNLTSATDRVGIGTSNPATVLHVLTTGATKPQFILQNSTATTQIETSLAGNSVQWNYGMDQADGSKFKFSTDGSGNLAASTLLTMTTGGSVGIGTATPATKLDVNGGYLHVSGLCGNTVPNAQGVYLSWNQSCGTGETDLINHQGQGGGGFAFKNTPNGTTVNTLMSISGSGDLTVSGNISAKYQDVAEWVPSTQKLSAGTVVVLDAGRINHVLASTKSYDTGVAGVISDSPGVILGVGGEGQLKVATTGRVKVRADATRAPISVGDLLVTSDTEGVAMKSVEVDLGGIKLHRPGTIIGKALEPLATGTGEILVLLSLQ